MRMNRMPVQKRLDRALTAAGEIPPALQNSLRDIPGLLQQVKQLTARNEALENQGSRFERKLYHLTWREADDQRTCRHCQGEFPDHSPECLAKNITVLKNP